LSEQNNLPVKFYRKFHSSLTIGENDAAFGNIMRKMGTKISVDGKPVSKKRSILVAENS
jgi:hypothetical protein